MIEIRINPEELPKGLSAVRVLEGSFGYISFGNGNNHGEGHKKVVLASFNEFDLYIIAGQTLFSQLNAEKEKGKWPPLVLDHTFSYLVVTNELAPTLQRIIEAVKKRAFDQGVTHTQSKLREAIGILE